MLIQFGFLMAPYDFEDTIDQDKLDNLWMKWH